MFLFINVLILALLASNGVSYVAEHGPTCRAELSGQSLLTIVELPTGVAVEGPWRVIQGTDELGTKSIVLVATLDHVIETDELTGNRSVIPFPHPVRLAFEGDTRKEAAHRAARVWCATVMRAQENRDLEYPAEVTQRRITAVPRAIDAA
jgi:hypothetical protein